MNIRYNSLYTEGLSGCKINISDIILRRQPGRLMYFLQYLFDLCCAKLKAEYATRPRKTIVRQYAKGSCLSKLNGHFSDV